MYIAISLPTSIFYSADFYNPECLRYFDFNHNLEYSETLSQI